MKWNTLGDCNGIYPLEIDMLHLVEHVRFFLENRGYVDVDWIMAKLITRKRFKMEPICDCACHEAFYSCYNAEPCCPEMDPSSPLYRHLHSTADSFADAVVEEVTMEEVLGTGSRELPKPTEELIKLMKGVELKPMWVEVTPAMTSLEKELNARIAYVQGQLTATQMMLRGAKHKIEMLEEELSDIKRYAPGFTKK